MKKSRLPKWLIYVEKKMELLNINSRAGLAKELGIDSPSTVNNWWLRSLKNPPSKYLPRLAEILMCSEVEIIAGKDKKDSFSKFDINLLRLIKRLSLKQRIFITNIANMFLVEQCLLSKKSQNILKTFDNWFVTIDKEDNKTFEPIHDKSKLSCKSDLTVKINLH